VAAALKEERLGIKTRAIADYLEWWKATYVEGYRHEDYIMNFALPFVIDSEDDLNYIFSLVAHPLPACWNRTQQSSSRPACSVLNPPHSKRETTYPGKTGKDVKAHAGDT